MRITTGLLIAALALGVAGLSAGPVKEARAGGGFHVSIGTGYHFGHGHYGRYKHGYRPWHRPWYRRHDPRYSLWGHVYRPWHRPWYEPPPRTVYILPPPQAVIEPPPVVQQAPAVQRAPTMAYDTSYCREYSRTAVVDGAPVEIYGTACRQPDGSWRIMN